jgi:hypothetical protein
MSAIVVVNPNSSRDVTAARADDDERCPKHGVAPAVTHRARLPLVPQ